MLLNWTWNEDVPSWSNTENHIATATTMGVRNFELYFIHSKIFQIFFLSSDSKYFPWVHQVFRIKCQFYVPFNQRRVRWIVDLRHANDRIIVVVLLLSFILLKLVSSSSLFLITSIPISPYCCSNRSTLPRPTPCSPVQVPAF